MILAVFRKHVINDLANPESAFSSLVRAADCCMEGHGLPLGTQTCSLYHACDVLNTTQAFLTTTHDAFYC